MLSYREKVNLLRERKIAETQKKQKAFEHRRGFFDTDDKGWICPPESYSFEMEFNHPNGVFGPKGWGDNFFRFLNNHPPYVDPICSLAGAYMDKLEWRGWGGWRPEAEFNPPELAELRALHSKYNMNSGLGGSHHFHHDVKNIGFTLGFGGILAKIRSCMQIHKDNPEKLEFLQGEEKVLLGIQQWIKHNAEAAQTAARQEECPDLKANLERMAAMGFKLMNDPPETFIEACQFLTYFLIQSSMFNGSGAGGCMEDLLTGFYRRDLAAGAITRDEAIYHIACLLLKDTQYFEIGGTWPDGSDRTNEISWMTLEAAHWIKIPTALCLRIHEGIDKDFVKQSVKWLFEDKCGNPAYLGDRIMVEGFMKNGYSAELACQRYKVGCNWCALPGIEYTLNDVVKINMAKCYEIAMRELEEHDEPSMDLAWELFDKHLDIAIACIKSTVDYHYDLARHMRPEMALNFMCHGPIERGIDIAGGGVDHYNFCIDFVALGTVADSFAAMERAIDEEQAMSWTDLFSALRDDWEGREDMRLYMRNTPRYGFGGTNADAYAKEIVERLNYHTKKSGSPRHGFNMIPGLFSWANTIGMGAAVSATANGRKAGAPVTHGANPEPGFRESGALTAMGVAVAGVQPAWGNTAPIQLEIDPVLAKGEEGIDNIMSWLMTYCCDLGGSLVNINILDGEKLLDAYENPEKYPDLVVRITGFSVYFSLLTPEFRKLVVERMITA